MKVLQFANLQGFPELVHGVATAGFGNMSFLYGQKEEVVQNRLKFFAALEVDPTSVVATSLLHGHEIIDAGEADRSRGVTDPATLLEGDILVSNKPNVFLFFVVADCLALFLYEPVKQVVALAHAGWRGVDQQVPQLAVEHMVQRYGCEPKEIRVGMSPAIQAKSYTIKVEMVNQASNPRWQPYLHQVGNEYQIDFAGFAYDQLIQSGIKPENIERSDIDTRTSPEYFSHRRSQETKESEGRFGCLIGLKN